MTTHSPYRHADLLGGVISEHPVKGTQQVVRIVLGLFCLVVALDCVWLGMWPRFGEIQWGGFAVTGVIALIFFWLAYDAFAQFARARKQRVTCHEFGLRIHDGKNSKDVRFDDVTSVGGVLWQSGSNGIHGGAVLWIDDVQGSRFELPTPIADALELGASIRKLTFDKRHAEALDRISKGEEVHFGRILLGSLVIVINGAISPRSKIEVASVTSRWLSLRIVGEREQMIPTEEIPNLDVCLALLDR
jgi:hypothetical protein